MVFNPEIKQTLAQKSRNVAVAITAGLCLWFGAQWIGVSTPFYAMLLNLVTLAVFFWCMIASYQIWRIRRENLKAEDKPHA